jgi:hypothetical protein
MRRANDPMNCAVRSIAAVMTCALAVLLGSVSSAAQATVDAGNSYPSVGAIMVWRVDDSGKPVQLLAFASGLTGICIIRVPPATVVRGRDVQMLPDSPPIPRAALSQLRAPLRTA